MANRQIDELTYASTITDATSIPVNNNTATYEAQQLTVGKLGDFLGSRASAVHNLGDVYTNNSSLVIDNPGALPAWTGEYITNANNTYPDLYTWLKTSHNELCVTRAAYDAAITADGECKYFVIDEESGSIRFPKYSYTAPEYPWIYCFNAAVPQTTTQGAEYTASLISKVSKAGDTMTGQLVMANGSNGIKFQGTNDNNYYVNFSNDLLKVIKTLSGQTLSSELITPVGSLIMGPIPEANCPDGYLICNGQDVSRTKYAELFSLLGTNFGVGDGSTTFNIPDYRGCFLRMLSTDTNENTNMYAKQASALPNITGYDCLGWSGMHIGIVNNSGDRGGALKATQQTRSGGLGGAPSGNTSVARGIAIDASLSSPVYQNGLTEARVTNFSINYYIKY